MAKPTDSHAEHARMEHAGGARYWIAWVALLVGTIVTYAVSRVHLHQPWALLIAMAIACAKAMLVVLFFMHLWDHGAATTVPSAAQRAEQLRRHAVVHLEVAVREAAEHDALEVAIRPERPRHLADRDARRALHREAVGAGGDRGEGERAQPRLAREAQALAVAAREQRVLA